MRPVALDDSAHFRIDRSNDIEVLNLLPDGFQLLGLEPASLVKFYRCPALRKNPKLRTGEAWGYSHATRGGDGRAAPDSSRLPSGGSYANRSLPLCVKRTKVLLSCRQAIAIVLALLWEDADCLGRP